MGVFLIENLQLYKISKEINSRGTNIQLNLKYIGVIGNGCIFYFPIRFQYFFHNFPDYDW